MSRHVWWQFAAEVTDVVYGDPNDRIRKWGVSADRPARRASTTVLALLAGRSGDK